LQREEREAGAPNPTIHPLPLPDRTRTLARKHKLGSEKEMARVLIGTSPPSQLIHTHAHTPAHEIRAEMAPHSSPLPACPHARTHARQVVGIEQEMAHALMDAKQEEWQAAHARKHNHTNTLHGASSVLLNLWGAEPNNVPHNAPINSCQAPSTSTPRMVRHKLGCSLHAGKPETWSG